MYNYKFSKVNDGKKKKKEVKDTELGKRLSKVQSR